MKMHLLANGLLTLPLISGALSLASIFKGRGFGTYYYDVEHPQGLCGDDFSDENTGDVECSNLEPLTLNQINSNFLVAMNHTQLKRNPGKYCGKRVVVTVNGKTSDLPFFIGDGCVRCADGPPTRGVWNPNGAPGLDFSYSALSALNSDACQDGHIDISWEIVDQTLYHF